ncbi:septal ring lytic transglycosylase RlpA family lipoprotein, partial [Vibrio splendidus]
MQRLAHTNYMKKLHIIFTALILMI